jgi:peroxiredoxin
MEAGLTYISDPDEVVIRRYGLQDSTLGEAVARPASFIVDRDGRVAWRYLPTDWRLRAGPDVYMNALGPVMRSGGSR